MVSVSVTSNGGVVTGDNPITHALLLLIIQITLIIALSRCLALLLRPLRQPRVVAGKLISLTYLFPCCQNNKFIVSFVIRGDIRTCLLTFLSSVVQNL